MIHIIIKTQSSTCSMIPHNIYLIGGSTSFTDFSSNWLWSMFLTSFEHWKTFYFMTINTLPPVTRLERYCWQFSRFRRILFCSSIAIRCHSTLLSFYISHNRSFFDAPFFISRTSTTNNSIFAVLYRITADTLYKQNIWTMICKFLLHHCMIIIKYNSTSYNSMLVRIIKIFWL